jgi:hypothetical protein
MRTSEEIKYEHKSWDFNIHVAPTWALYEDESWIIIKWEMISLIQDIYVLETLKYNAFFMW